MKLKNSGQSTVVKTLPFGGKVVTGQNNGSIHSTEPGATSGKDIDASFVFQDKQGNTITRWENLNDKGKVEVRYKKLVDNPENGKPATATNISGEEFATLKNEAGFDPNKRLQRDENGLIIANEANKKILDSAN
jgi:hypothetical protein